MKLFMDRWKKRLLISQDSQMKGIKMKIWKMKKIFENILKFKIIKKKIL